jgi:mannose-6-phosphate isomerase-like protein (cupin superfamily)
MPVRHIESAIRVPVPGGKVIDEYVGRVSNGEERVSVAHMKAPPGWSEPAQAPAFDEYTVVLSGALHVEHDGGTLEVRGGQAVLTPAGERVRYRAGDGGAEYIAVCLPAFALELANRAPEDS